MDEGTTKSLTPPADSLFETHCGNRWLTYRSHGQLWATRLLHTAPGGSIVLAALPTGGGKSLTFLLPLLEYRRTHDPRAAAIVVTPTISLMADMVRNIDDHYKRIHGWTLEVREYHSGVESQQKRQTEQDFVSGTVDVLFVSPETIVSPYFQRFVLQRAGERVAFFVIDEAHLVADWGAQFRPEFQRLGHIREIFVEKNSSVRTHLMSATVSHETETLLRSVFDVPDNLWRTVRDSPLRMEALISIEDAGRTRAESERWLRDHVDDLQTPALVYVTRPVHAEEIARLIAGVDTERQLRVASYHGDTPGEERARVVKDWRAGDLDVVVGTSAFGLGIDKPDVRTVVHLCIPESLDRLYQEIGRAGRDGNECVAIVASVEEDADIARSSRLVLLLPETLEKRWQELLKRGSELHWMDGDPLWIFNETTLPDYWRPHLGLTHAGGHNEDWNQSALNFLQRHAFVRYEGAGITAVRGTVLHEPIAVELDRVPSIAELLAGSVAGEAFGLTLDDLAAKGVPPQQAIAELEALGAMPWFHVIERKYGSLFRVKAELITSDLSQMPDLTARREEEMSRAADNIERAVQYARRSGRERCLRKAFAETYDLPFSHCGRCDVCHARAWTSGPAFAPSPPEPWPDALTVSRPFQGLDAQHLIGEPLMDRPAPAGQLRLLPALIACGVTQVVAPDDWPVRGFSAMHTLNTVAHRVAMLERVPTLVIVDDVTTSNFASAFSQLTHKAECGFFSRQTPLIWLVAPTHFGEWGRTNATRWTPEVLVQRVLEELGVRAGGNSLNPESRPGWTFPKITPEDRIQAAWWRDEME